MICHIYAANRPTLVNIQTSNGLIHYPIITSVSETDVIIDGTTAIPISSINQISERNQTMIFMAEWTLEQKRNFFISALNP